MAHLKNIYTPVVLQDEMAKTLTYQDPKQLQQQMPSPSQPFSSIHNFNIDEYEKFEQFSPVEDNTPVKDDPPVEAPIVASAKPKKKKSRNDVSTSEPSKEQRNIPWTQPEEIVLAKAWVSISEDNTTGNAKPLKGLWIEILSYFQNEMKISRVRTHDSLNGKWKELRLKVGRFCGVYDNVKRRNQSGADEVLILQQAIGEYNAQYNANFHHLHVWRILKDEPKWIQIELPKSQDGNSEKPKTLDSTSFNTSESAHGGLNLNSNMEDDKSKKKATISSGSSTTPSDPHYEVLMQRMERIETVIWNEKKEQWAELIAIKQSEIDLRNKEIDIQQKQFQFLQDKQRQKDILFYTSPHGHFTGLQLEKVLQIKNEIKEKYGLDY